MNFDLTDEQSLLRDSVARFVASHYSLQQRVAIARSKSGFSAEHWRTMADLGWLALPFAEGEGGLGGSLIDTMIVMEQFGKGLVLEPFFASIVLGGGVLRHGASPEQRARLTPGVIDGSVQLALAHTEEQARFDLADVMTSARAIGDEYVLSGVKSFVANGGSAQLLLVSARTTGHERDTNGITLFLVSPSSSGVTVEASATIDGGHAAQVTLSNVRVARADIVGRADAAHGILTTVANEAILALAAEAVGAMAMLYQDTVQYVQQRVQFDRPLSDFQVLQHRMVDMFTEYELAKSLLYRATLEAMRGSPDAQRSIHALKYMVAKAGAYIAENAVQLHGGMGMTEELRVGHYFKRLVAIDLLFGNGDHHLRKFADADR